MPEPTSDSNNQSSAPQGARIQFSQNDSFSHGTPPPVTVKASKKLPKKVLWTLLAVGGLFVTAGLTIGILLFTNGAFQPKKEAVEPLTFANVGQALVGVVQNPSGASFLTAPVNDPYAVIYKVENGWVGLEDDAPIVSFTSIRSDRDANKADFDAVSTLFAERTLQTVGAQTSVPSSYDAEQLTKTYYANDTIACVVMNVHDQPATMNGGDLQHGIRVDCAALTSFAATAAATAEYRTAYAKANQDATTDMLFGVPMVQNGSAEGTSTARLMVRAVGTFDGTVADFYKTSQSSEWVYLTRADDRDKIACSVYATDEIINVYMGVTCWDSTTNSSAFVRKPNPTFEIVPGSIGG